MNTNMKPVCHALRRCNIGITLIELVVVMAIIAILAAVAIPSYRSYILRSNRAEAKAALLNVRVAQEKWFLQNNTYTSLNNLNINNVTAQGNYTLDFAPGTLTATTFTAVATPTGAQAADADCAAFTIDQSGNRTPNPDPNSCWR